MRKNSIIFTTLSLLLSTLFCNSTVFAGDIEWSGLYRIEGYQIHNSELRGGGQKHLDYALSHLILRPKFTAGDGFTIYSQFELFNSNQYPNSQMGEIWGDGVGVGYNSSNLPKYPGANSSSTISNTQKAQTLEVSQLYMTYNQEFGQLIVGRVPLQFGLGMTYSAGRGMFDHFYDSSDLVGYKVIFGPIYILPMLGKPSSGNINQSNDLDDYMIQAEYENPETDIHMGIFYQWRKGGDQAADAPVGIPSSTDPGAVVGGPGATNSLVCTPNPNFSCSAPVDTRTINIYALRDTDRFRIGMEASFMSGNTGVVDAVGDKVAWGGYGIATEFEYRPEASRWKWGLKAGLASGDDPTTASKFEGYIFNRNYDVAMLLFNHPLGQADFLRTGMVTGNVYDPTAPGQKNIGYTDVEAISNVLYVAPVAKWAFSEHWSLDNTLVTGWLNVNPMPNQQGNALGYEWDVAVNYMPRKGITWVTQMGLLFPGQAWQGDGSQTNGVPNFDNGFAYGFGTKAAISF